MNGISHQTKTNNQVTNWQIFISRLIGKNKSRKKKVDKKKERELKKSNMFIIVSRFFFDSDLQAFHVLQMISMWVLSRFESLVELLGLRKIA